MSAGADVIEAVVQIGERETPYLRCGRGCDVAVVVSWDAEERARLMQFFAPVYRVVAPVIDHTHAASFADSASLIAWLGDVIEGLGVERPLIVVRRPA